jgi:hypothetical protein
MPPPPGSRAAPANPGCSSPTGSWRTGLSRRVPRRLSCARRAVPAVRSRSAAWPWSPKRPCATCAVARRSRHPLLPALPRSQVGGGGGNGGRRKLTHLRTPEFDRIARAFGWSRDPARKWGTTRRCFRGTAPVLRRPGRGRPLPVGLVLARGRGLEGRGRQRGRHPGHGRLPGHPRSGRSGWGRRWGDDVFAGLARGALEACAAYGCAWWAATRSAAGGRDS